MDQYQQYIHISRYARWVPSLGRRETWEETVQRYINFFDERTKGQHTYFLNEQIAPRILNLEVMPSMRALMTAGPALQRENIAGFNCSYLAINNVKAFSEALYVLMCGTGVGFSCERQEISQLPEVPAHLNRSQKNITYQVGDSKEGWALAYQTLLNGLYKGTCLRMGFDHVRPAGARLKTFGGRASGPEPLKRLFKFTIDTFMNARGRKLTSIEVHDLMCMIGEIVVVGGVRRSALISLSNLSDKRMRDAKSGSWWESNPQRALANNSVAYTEKPSSEIFMEEWLSLVKSKSGERGIFNREAACKQAARWGRRPLDAAYGCNPCSEIILKDKQFCNLTEVVIRADDTLATLLRKVEIATIMGTLQATLTDFNFLSADWCKNTKEEALLGVSLTGIMDNALMSGSTGEKVLASTLRKLRDHAREVNRKWAKALGIAPSAAITCVKPSGTVSQLCDSASGIHARHNDYYLRTVRVDKKDPLYHFMKDKGFWIADDVMRPDSTAVVYFPIKAPDGCVTRNSRSALASLDLWLLYQRNWCEHKPSVTITVKDDEWVEVGAWVYKHFDEVSGISFLPHTDHTYEQAPYQDLTRVEFQKWTSAHKVPEVDWTSFKEEADNTEGTQTLACTGSNCEI